MSSSMVSCGLQMRSRRSPAPTLLQPACRLPQPCQRPTSPFGPGPVGRCADRPSGQSQKRPQRSDQQSLHLVLDNGRASQLASRCGPRPVLCAPLPIDLGAAARYTRRTGTGRGRRGDRAFSSLYDQSMGKRVWACMPLVPVASFWADWLVLNIVHVPQVGSCHIHNRLTRTRQSGRQHWTCSHQGTPKKTLSLSHDVRQPRKRVRRRCEWEGGKLVLRLG